MGTSVMFWRWRRNPLRRGTDRAEAWAVLVSGLLLAVGAPAAGVAAGLAVMAHAPRPPAGWHRVSAVVVRDATAAVTAGTGPTQVLATVRWQVPQGHTRTGQALVRAGSPAGSRTTVWLDRTGAPRDDPLDPARDQARAIVCGTAAASGTALAASGGLALAHRRLDRRRAAQLDRKWERVGPEWGRHRA